MYRVAYWRKTFLFKALVGKFEQVYKHGSFTQGDWVEVTAPIFFDLKKKIQKEKFRDRVYIQYKGASVDLTLPAMQRIVMQYERVYHFYKLVGYFNQRESDTDIRIVNFNIREYLDDLGLAVDCNEYNSIFNLNSFLDGAWEYSHNIIYLSAVFLRVLKNLFKKNVSDTPFKEANIKYFWHCLSFNEMASSKNSYDATALVQRGLLSNGESFFLLPVDPSEAQIQWLSKNRIIWASNKSLYNILPKLAQIKILFWLTKISCFTWGIRGKKALKSFLITPLITDMVKFEFFNHIDAKVLLTGQSGGLLESPIVSLARGLDKRTVWWSYAGVGTKHIPRPLPFEYGNEQVEASITLSEEKWVWLELDKIMLEKRSLLPSGELQTTLRTLGPMMSGDSRWLSKSPLQARKEFGLNGNSACKIWITVFDMPTFDKNLHIEHRWPAGSAISEEMQSAFFSDIKFILENYSDIGVIYKPKRSSNGRNSSKYILQDELLDFIDNNKWVKSKRLIILSNNIDPYIPIALCDYAIAMPYTSVLLAVLASNRDGIYYDSTSTICSTYPEELNNVTLCNRTSFIEKIELWRNSKAGVNKELLKFVSYNQDPGKNFAINLENISSESQ